MVCNAGLSTGLDQTALVSEFSKYGDIIDVCLLRDKSYCFVVCADEINARKIYENTHAKSRLGQNDTVIYLTYSTEGMLRTNLHKLFFLKVIVFEFSAHEKLQRPESTEYTARSCNYRKFYNTVRRRRINQFNRMEIVG